MKNVIIITILLAMASLANAYAGDIYMADSVSGKILVFDNIGKRAIVLGLDDPESIAFDNNGNLYIAVKYEGEIENIDIEGNCSNLASGLKQPSFITSFISDPSTILLLGFASLVFFQKPHKKYNGNYSYNHPF